MRSINTMLKVEGSPNLVRDPSTHAIISMNDSDYDAYKRKREAERKSRQMIQDQVKQIEDIKNEMTEIKALLSQLLKGK